MTRKNITVVGADTSAVEVSPNPDKDLSVPVHQLLIARNGIYLHENRVPMNWPAMPCMSSPTSFRRCA